MCPKYKHVYSRTCGIDNKLHNNEEIEEMLVLFPLTTVLILLFAIA